MKICGGRGRREEEDEGWKPKAARETFLPTSSSLLLHLLSSSLLPLFFSLIQILYLRTFTLMVSMISLG